MDWFFRLQGYPLIFTATFFEGSGIPFPGGFLLAWSGFILGRDLPDLAMATGLGVAGYVLGAIIPYFLGHLGGRPVVIRLFSWLKLSTTNIDVAQNWFNRYGLLIVAASRPFFLGNYISFVAGMAHTPLLPFLLCTGLGILPWVIVYLYLGMFFGKHWSTAVELAAQYSLITFLFILIIILAFIFKDRILQFFR